MNAKPAKPFSRRYSPRSTSHSAKFENLISRSTVIPQTQERGKTLFKTHPTHKVTDQYRQLAAEIEERLKAMLGEPVSKPAGEVLPKTVDRVMEAVANG